MAEVTQSPPKHHKTDGNAGFLRAARDGNLDEVLDYLKGSTDINTSNPNGLNALHLASKEGHINIVTELLNRGANVEAATKKGNTALHIASLAGHEDIVRKLVERGAQVNLQAQAGFTPLYMASQEGHAEVVKFLLSSGANQGLSTEDGFTPLAVALQQGHDKVVSVLLEHDAKGKVRLPALHIAAKKDDVKSAALLLQNEQNSVELQTKGGLVNDTTKSGFTPLHIAAHYGNTNVANLLIQRNADVNFRAKNNITPLHVGSRWGKLNMVNLLLDNNATIDEKTRDGLTPLHCAARSGHDSVVDTLLERGAPHSAKTKNGLTPLHMAAQGDHEDCARLLLYHKASLNEVTVDYLTPLHVAAHCGNVKTAKLLLDRKCEPNARALNGFTPLHIACKKNRIKVVELLLKYGASIETKTESGLTPLHVASFMGHMNIVIYLIQHNANPNTATVRGETSLHLAARANQSDIIRILLRNGATVDARAREQQTPLHIAARLGNVDNVVLLLQHGAQVDATTKDKYTPLHIAAKEGHDEVAQVLLENEAQHDITTKKGFTPLHIAAKYGNIKVARLLLQKEANPDAQGKNGLTPLHVATHYNHANVAQLLLENKANPHATAKNGYTPLHIAAKKNQMDIATMLLEYGAKPNAESKNGFTPLHLAAQEGHTDIVSLLLEKQANVNAKAHNGLTPMHLAAQEDRVPVAEILCKYGAETDTSTKAGYTPLHTACHFGQVNMVRFLLDHEASVNATTKVGYTPLHQAAQQGHVQVVSTLLKNQASPNAVTNNGQTPLAIAQKLGYISVVEILKPVTEVQGISPATEDKYKVVSPETMQETFISDSEDEGADDFLPQSPIFGKPISEQHVYLPYYEGQKMTNREDSVSLERGGSASPLDTSFDKDYMDAQITSQSFQGVYSAAPPTAGRLPVGTETNRFSSYSGSSFSTSFDPDNVPVDRSPVYSGFLISFMVDARGGAMRGCRHPGVRIIIPPRKCSMPTRITCRLVKKEKLTKPPPMLEGEGLAARVLEMGPVGTKFLGPVLLEVPHFASLRGKEREVVILRTDNGESWYEHPMQATEDAVAEALGSSAEELDSEEDLSKKRIKRILTTDLPMYFALVSRVTRVKQESTVIGMEGGVLSSNVVPQVQAVLPEGTLTRPIPVGLQAQPIAPELVAKLLGNRVAVSPIVTIEPRRRKFHKPITLTIPVPRAAQKGMINQYGGERPTLRLLFSLAGNNSHGRADPNPASWEDVTDTKPMTLQDDCVSFTTTVSARFWLIDCQNVAEAAQMASVLYQEAVTVPYMAKFVVYAKRDSPEEGKLRIFCMTDDKDDKTLEKQEKFFEVARSRDIEVLEGRPQFVEMAGNLIPVTKSGDQLHVNFRAFRENRLPCTVKVRDQDQEASARVAFMKEPKVARGEAPQTPICNLNIRLPDMVLSESGELDTDKAAEIRKRHDFLRGQGLVIQDSVNRSEMKLSDIADTVQGDWVVLAQQLHISISDINHFKNDYKTVGDQALAMLHFWVEKNGDKATGNQLENALRRINREDVVRKCMYNTERVDDELEAAAARVAMDQSGFDTFKEEVGITKDSMKRGMSLDVQYDEQDMIKESESATEESPTGDRGEPVPSGYRPPQVTVVSAGPATTEDEDDWIQAARDMRRPVAEPHKSPQEDEEESRRRKEAFLDLAQQMDKFAELEDAQRLSQDADDTSAHSVSEEEIVRSAKTSPSEAFPALRQGVSSVQYSQQQQVQQESRPVERPRVTFSDEADTIRRGEQSEEGYGQDDEEVLTPPPSPTEKFDTEEPVLAAESSVAAAASRLASEAAEEQADSGDDTASDHAPGWQPSHGQTSVEREVMYSRAEVESQEVVRSSQDGQALLSESASQLVSPTSDGGSSYNDEPSPVPEPTLPEDFHVDELAYEIDSQLEEDEMADIRGDAVDQLGDYLREEEDAEGKSPLTEDAREQPDWLGRGSQGTAYPSITVEDVSKLDEEEDREIDVQPAETVEPTRVEEVYRAAVADDRGTSVDDVGTGVDDIGPGTVDASSPVDDVGRAISDVGTAVDEGTDIDNMGTRAHDEGTLVDDFGTEVDDEGTEVDDDGTAIDDVRTAIDDVRTAIDDGSTAVDDVRTSVDDGSIAVDDEGTAVDDVGTQVDEEGTAVDGLVTAPGSAPTDRSGMHLMADLGYEEFVDRYEETIQPQKIILSPEEIPERHRAFAGSSVEPTIPFVSTEFARAAPPADGDQWDTAGLGVDEAAYKDKGQDVYKMEVEEEEEEKERVMEQLDLSQTTTEEVQYVEAEIRIEEDYREGAAEYSVSVSQEVTETFAGEEVTPLEVEQAREAAVVTEEVDAVQVPGEEIATQEIVQEEVVSRSEEDKLIEEQVTTQFSSVVVSSGVSQIETHYDFEEAEECQARQVAEEMAQAESVTVVHSAEQIHAAESMVYAAPDESSELHEESAESQPEEDVVPVVATEVEAESPITDIKYSSLTDPSTTQMVRETIESIEEVVTSMERKFEKSTTEKFESTTYTEKLSTEDDGHGSGRTEDVLDFEMVREEFRSEVTEDASETTQDFSEIRSELVESMESQQDLDSRRTSDIRMEAESDFFVKDRGETPVLQREEEETDVTRTAQVEEEHVRHERISESSVVEDRDEDRFDARAEADLSIQESLTRVVHSDVRYQVARESEEICETAHLVHTETQDTDMVAVVRGEEEITEVYMTKEERYEEDGEEIEAAVGGEDVVEEETESQELDEEILQFEREEREVERELRMEEETEMIEKESEETEVDREIREERIELETERTEEEEVLYREEKRELETEERKLETMEKEEERELETEEKEEERELETEERDEGELEALEREKEERELGIEEKEEERELATEEKEEKRELETEEKEEERKLEALEREEEERELEIEEKEEERELEEREEERELETEEQEEARELETEEREDERELETEEKEDREVEAEEREEREIAVSEKDTDKELVEEKEDERELEMEEKEDEREVAVDSREERELVVHGTEERTLEIKSEEEDRELMFDEEDQPAQAEDVISAQSMAYVESSVSCLPDEEEKEIEDTGVEETVTVSKRQTTQAQLDNRTSQETETLETREEAQFTSHTLSQYVFEEGQSYYREERTDTESVQRADDEVDTVYHREVLESTQTTIATLPDEEEKEIQDDGTDRPDGTEYVLSMETTAETPHMFDKEVYESDDDDWELLDKKDLTQEEVAQAEQLTMESTVDTRDFSDSDLEHTKHERVDWTYGDQATEEEKEGEKEEEISDEDIEEKSVSPTQEVMTRKEMVGSEEMLAAASQVIDMAAVDGHVPYSGSSGQISEAEMVSMPEEETGFQVDAINIGVVEEAQDEMEGTAVEVEVRRFSEPDQSEMIGEVLVQDSEIQSKGEVHITHEILAEISVSAVEVEEAKEEEHISEFDMIRERIQVEEETEMRETVEITSPSEVSVPGFADGDLSPTVECQAAEFSVIQSDQAFSEEVEALSEAVAVTVVSQASVSEATTQHVHEESYTTSIQQTFEETREGTETLFADSTVVISKTDVGGETMLMEEEEREDYSPSDTSLPQEAEEAEDDSEEEEEEEADKDVDAELEQEIEEQDRLTAALAHVQDKSDEEDQEEYEQESPTSGPCQEESGPDVVRLTTETSLDQITEQSGESELSKSQELPEFSAEGEQGKSEEDKDQIVRDSLDQDYKETPSTEEGEYSMKTEPSLKEVKEEDYAEDKSEVRDEEEVLEDEDVDEAFEKYEGEPEVVVPLDAKIGEHVESFEEDIDRAFERYEHERTTSEYVEEVSETLQVTEDVDQEQAELQEERPTETVDGSTEQEVVEKAEDADQESEMVTGTVREQVQESRQVEDYEMELSKAIVEEALQTSLETQKKLDTDDDKQEEEEEEARRPSGIMAEMQFLEEQQTKDEMMSDDDLDDNEYEEEEDKADVIAKKLEEGDQPVDEEEDEEEADMRQEPFVDRLESKIEKAESAVVDVSITQEVEHSVDRTETKLELSQSSEIVKEMERSVDRVEIFTLDEKAGFVSQKEEAGTVMTGEEEVTPADDEIVVFIDRREEFIEILPDTVRPDDDNEEKIASFQTSDRTSKEPETSMGAGGDVSSSGEQKAEGPSQQQQAPSDHSTAAFHVQMSFQSAGTTDAEELTSPGNLEEEIIEMEKKLNQMKEIVGEESQEEEFVEAKTSLSPPQDQDAAKEEEKRQMFMASSISGSDYTSPSDVEYAQSGTTGSGSYYTAQSDVMSSSSYTAPSETMTGSEYTMTASEHEHEADEEYESEGRISTDISQQIYIEHKVGRQSERREETTSSSESEAEDEMDRLDRPPSPSEFTLIASQDQERLNISLGLTSKAETYTHTRYSERTGGSSFASRWEQTTQHGLYVQRDSDIERDSLQEDEEEDNADEEEEEEDEGEAGRMSVDEAGGERPPSPSDFTLIASQDQESLQLILGQEEVPEQETGSPMQWEQDLEKVMTDPDAQSTASSDAALMIGLDRMSVTGTDNNTMSGFSSESGHQVDTSDSPKDQCYPESSGGEELDDRQDLYQAYLKEVEAAGEEEKARSSGLSEGEDQPEAVHTGLEQAEIDEELDSNEPASLSQTNEEITSYDLQAETAHIEGALASKEESKDTLSSDAEHISPQAHFDDIVHDDERGGEESRNLELEEMVHGSEEEKVMAMRGERGKFTFSLEEQRKSSYTDQEEEVQMDEERSEHAQSQGKGEGRVHFSHYFEEEMKVGSSSYGEQVESRSEHKSSYSSTQWEFGVRQHVEETSDLPRHAQEAEEKEEEEEGEEVGDLAAAMGGQAVDKMSSSSSEVAQLDDFDDQGIHGVEQAGTSDEEGAHEADEPSSPGAQGDEDVLTHRVMMKKEVHKKTTVGLDGQEETTVREDSQIQQDNEPPEELRESMQEIINQFMETDPQPAALPPSQSLEDDV